MTTPIAILMIEDSHRDAQLMLGELRKHGYDPTFERVYTAETVKTALAAKKWDVILSDYQMPQFTGLEALKILKETRQDIPFILISGAVGEEIAVQIMKIGAQDYLLKSSLTRLVPAIEREIKEAKNRKNKRKAEEKLQRYYQELEQRIIERTDQLAQMNVALNQEIEIRKQTELKLRQAKQDAEEANRQKTRIMAFVSHDFKTPLVGLQRALELVEKDAGNVLDTSQHRMIKLSIETVEQLRGMVADILDKAQMEEGRVIPSLEWIQLHPFMDQLKSTFDALSEKGKIGINIDIHMEMKAIEADPAHFRQILINLVSNAVKYNRPEGEVFLRFSPSEDRQWVILEIQDTGMGIPQEKIAPLFTEYYRTAQNHEVEGTGLGLAFVKKLVELHGGTITVESEIDVGSTFRVALPFLAQVSSQPHRAVPDGVKAALMRKRKRTSQVDPKASGLA